MKSANGGVPVTDQNAVVDVDGRFFNALLNADVAVLDQILAEDLVLIDVMRGGETKKTEFLQAVQSGLVVFEAIEVMDQQPRVYGECAIINGKTQLTIRFDNTTFEIRSRYTHVYCELEGAWRMVSAQGTRIAD